MEPLFKSAPVSEAAVSWTGRWAQLLGLFFVVDGVWGLFSPVTFGLFTTNLTHSVIHLALGVAGLWLGSRAQSRAHRLQGDTATARGYVVAVGVLLAVVGVARFVPGLADVVVQVLNVNTAVAVLNITLGAVSLVVASLTGRRHLPAVSEQAPAAVRRAVPVARFSRV